MAKKAFAVFEIDFVLGIDEHSLTSLKPAAYKYYICAWSWCWKYSKDAKVDAFVHRKVTAFAQLDARTGTRVLQECCENALMQKCTNGHKLLGLLEKRAEYFHKKKGFVGQKAGDLRRQVDIEVDKEKEVEGNISDIVKDLKEEEQENAMAKIEREVAEEDRREAELWGN